MGESNYLEVKKGHTARLASFLAPQPPHVQPIGSLPSLDQGLSIYIVRCAATPTMWISKVIDYADQQSHRDRAKIS